MTTTTPSVCNTNYESFKILRSVPLCSNTNQQGCSNVWWVAISGNPGKIPDPNNRISWPPVNTSVNTPTVPPIVTSSGQEFSIQAVVNASNGGSTPLIVDSTRIVINNLLNNNFIDLTQEDAYCVFSSNQACSTTNLNIATNCYPGPASCYQNVCLADGVLQFLAVIQIAPSCTWLGTGLVITISPLNNSLLFKNCTYGNWCPFSFSIGNCNTQSSTASLLYLTCPVPSGYGYVYQANYANVRFTLLNKQKCAVGGARKACYLGVDSLDKGCFLVFFGQQRLVGVAQILLISPIVDLKCIVWQPVFIVTTNTPLTLTCGAAI
jgi:hypothetical protein